MTCVACKQSELEHPDLYIEGFADAQWRTAWDVAGVGSDDNATGSSSLAVPLDSLWLLSTVPEPNLSAAQILDRTVFR